ncbi:MAG: sensor histidine kinase [Bdellovibrionales bacterium]
MRSESYFPSRLFRWIIKHLLLYSALALGLLAIVLLLGVEAGISDPDARAISRGFVLTALAAAFVIVCGISVFMARKLVVPLGRLIEKTRRLREFPFESEDSAPEALAFDEPGEWYELERALNRLGRDLRQKTIRLSREKTELRAIMSAVSEAVLAISSEQKVLFFNSQFAYLFEAAASEARLSEILRSPDVLEAYNETLTSGRPLRRDVQLTVSSERRSRHFQLALAPLRKKHNQEIYGAVGIFHDITELKQAERIRIEFVGNVSHELRTPLTTINGYLQTLVRDIESGRMDQAQEFLKIVSQNVGRLKHLVEDLLDLSALESGVELKFERVDVRDVTESVLSQVPTRQHRISHFYEFDEVWADPKRLEQVLRNLLENAVRYVPEGRHIEIRWKQGRAGHVELRVKDDGPGIASQHLSRLFERFYRVDQHRSRALGGTGIGLSLVKHIVQRHRGQVTVKTQLGQGSEFICEFPVGPDSRAAPGSGS